MSAAHSPARYCARSCAVLRSTSMTKSRVPQVGDNWSGHVMATESLLARRLDELYAIGAQPEGGTYRPLYSQAWVAALDRVERWFKDAGLSTRRDAVGNLWGRMTGGEEGKSIVTGSHIDTVRNGGRLDGALGIVAGLTAVESLQKERGKPRRTIEVVAI